MTLAHRTYHRDGTFWGEPTSGVIEYEQEHMEGPYMAKFIFKSGEKGVTDAGLKGWFNNKLMSQFETVFDGVVVWKGFVWEMELEMNGEVRIKSMEDVANAVKCSYTYTITVVDGLEEKEVSVDAWTDWFTNEESRERFGTKERIVSSSSSSSGEADERAEVEVQYSASPYTSAISYNDSEENTLSVTVVGRMVAANNVQLIPENLRYIAQLEDTDDPLYDYSGDEVEDKYNDTITVSDEIRRIVLVVNYSGGWLYVQDIMDNDTKTVAGVSSATGAFDRILELSKLRDSSGNFYRLSITSDGGVVYRPFEETADYIRYGKPRGIENIAGTKPTWNAKPGFIRYFDDTSGVGMPDTWVEDAQLAYYERTDMKDGDEIATFHGRELDASDVYNAISANRRRMKKPAKKAEKVEESSGPSWGWRLS